MGAQVWILQWGDYKLGFLRSCSSSAIGVHFIAHRGGGGPTIYSLIIFRLNYIKLEGSSKLLDSTVVSSFITAMCPVPSVLRESLHLLVKSHTLGLLQCIPSVTDKVSLIRDHLPVRYMTSRLF
jgi:hypothetical protein